jgi:hypothetical protein
MSESPSTAFQIDHTQVGICVLDPFPIKDQHISNFVHRHLVICYDPFSKLVERSFLLAEEPTEYTIRELISTSMHCSDRASPS